MPDKRVHRGPHPEDAVIFAPDKLQLLRNAVSDASWLLSKGYAEKSTLKLVGDRYNLTVRQRLAVMRSACSDNQLIARAQKEISCEASIGAILVDGYNLLITLESALAGSTLLSCRDGCIRDLASLYGTYRKVEETIPALKLVAQSVRKLEIAKIIWLFDRPVSNSGLLKSLVLQTAAADELNWEAELVFSPDKILAASENVIVTSDSVILDACRQWLNLAGYVISSLSPAHLLDLH